MASNQHTLSATPRKGLSFVGEPHEASDLHASCKISRAKLCPTPHLSLDQYVRLLACIEFEGGMATLDEISRALPSVVQPVSAVLDLCDAGILCADLAAAFDGNMRVWRHDR